LFVVLLLINYISLLLQCRQQNPCLPGSHNHRPKQREINIHNAILPTCCFNNSSSAFLIFLCQHSHNAEHPKTWSYSLIYSLTKQHRRGKCLSLLSLVLSCCGSVLIVVPFLWTAWLNFFTKSMFSSKKEKKMLTKRQEKRCVHLNNSM